MLRLVPCAIVALLVLLHAVAATWVTPKHAINVAPGWNVQGVTTSLTSPRTLLFDAAGHLLVLQQRKGIIALTLNADGSVASTKVVRDDSELNHGLALSPDGRTLYASSGEAVWSWTYDANAMTLSDQRRTLVTGMSQDGHSSRTLLISNAQPNMLYVSRGSSGNIDFLAVDPKSGRSTIKVFDLDNVPENGYDHASEGSLIAYGVRNEVGIVEDGAGVLWGVENGVDDAVRLKDGVSTDVHNDNPGEKLHSFGKASEVAAKGSETKNFGYPTCLSVWAPSAFPSGDSLQVGDFFVQEINGTQSDASCESAVKPDLMLQAHTAPLDIKFGVGDDTNAYIAFHGSWNRDPPVGYSLGYVQGSRSGSSGGWSSKDDLTSTTAVTDILTPPDITSCPTNCFRPTALVWSPDGSRLYVASDSSDEIVVVSRGVGTNAAGRRAKLPHVPGLRSLLRLLY
ncbi:soluble quino protein glucose dehydrogenase [Auriculariales sp. MPI-PUGE-AT-0066]|nr:soluble quino protein glucose dehydrogenase [Auriculariales sp. MPI-PUGE-AT-0066]